MAPFCQEYHSSLHKNLQVKARKELNETKEARENGIRQLREKLDSNGSLPLPRNEDKFLLRFLRHSKFDVQKAYIRTQNYSNTWIKYSSDVEAMRNFRDVAVLWTKKFGLMPKRDGNGSRILYMDVECSDVDEFDTNGCLQGLFILGELMLEEEETQISGFHVICKADQWTFRQMYNVQPFALKKLANILSRDMPLRVKGIHIVNSPTFIKWIFNLLSSLFSTKISKRMFFHSNEKELHKYIDPDYLPADVGGNLPEFDTAYTIELLTAWEPTWRTYYK